MYDVDKSTDGFSSNLNYVKTCSNGPQPGNAFCSEHAVTMKNNGVPVKLKEYLDFKKSVVLSSGHATKSAATCQGTYV